ncbi:MAG: hypothetical protein ACPLZC_00825 [Candidatus Bathyarchaeales archaeon]
MKNEELKTMVNVVNELNESYTDFIQTMKGTVRETRMTKKLWHSGNNSLLIKLGVALVVFPEPIISDVVGTFLIAAGTVQQGIKRHTIYVDDVYKTFHNTMKEIWATREHV